MNSWVVVANKALTKIYDVSRTSHSLNLVHVLENEKARLKTGDLESDDRGTTFNSVTGPGGRKLNKEKSTVDQALATYAIRVSDYIKREFNKKSFDKLVVVAGPGLLGSLTKELQKKKVKVDKKIGKELSGLSDKQLSETLRSELIETFPVSP